MLDASVLSDLNHGDRLQRELALTFARSLHAHFCHSCAELCICTVIDCPARRLSRLEVSYECFRCREARGSLSPPPRIEWAADEATGGGDE